MVKTLCISCAIYAEPMFSATFGMTWHQSNIMLTNQDVCLFAVSLNDNFMWSIDEAKESKYRSMTVNVRTLYHKYDPSDSSSTEEIEYQTPDSKPTSWGFCAGLYFVMHYFVSFLTLQSS